MGSGGSAVDVMVIGCLGVERRAERFFSYLAIFAFFSLSLRVCGDLKTVSEVCGVGQLGAIFCQLSEAERGRAGGRGAQLRYARGSCASRVCASTSTHPRTGIPAGQVRTLAGLQGVAVRKQRLDALRSTKTANPARQASGMIN
jgi:hypothetical protein